MYHYIKNLIGCLKQQNGLFRGPVNIYSNIDRGNNWHHYNTICKPTKSHH